MLQPSFCNMFSVSIVYSISTHMPIGAIIVRRITAVPNNAPNIIQFCFKCNAINKPLILFILTSFVSILTRTQKGTKKVKAKHWDPLRGKPSRFPKRSHLPRARSKKQIVRRCQNTKTTLGPLMRQWVKEQGRKSRNPKIFKRLQFIVVYINLVFPDHKIVTWKYSISTNQEQ